MQIADGETDPWWRWNSAAIYPEGSRDIGTSACNVATIYATNVSIGGVSAATQTDISAIKGKTDLLTVSGSNPQVGAVMSMNGKRITQVGAPVGRHGRGPGQH